MAAVQPLNIRTARGAVAGMAQWVQDEKIRISRTTIAKQQYAERWPEDYHSYIKSVKTSNLYKDPDKFFRVMHKSPKLYANRFIFLPIVDATISLKEAVLMANSIIHRQAQLYGRQTGFYRSSFRIALDGVQLRNVAELESLNRDSTVMITNIAAYAGKVEANAVYFDKIGGVLYHAAQKIKRAFPDLGVIFAYTDAQEVSNLGAYSKYNAPYILIGSRDVVANSITKPGKNHRRSARRAARLARLQARANARQNSGGLF